jgi:periplasmic protein TonB
MFQNLVESGFHTSERNRALKFLGFTFTGYVVLLVCLAIAGIYTYNTALAAPDWKVSILTTPVPVPANSPIVDTKPKPSADAQLPKNTSTRIPQVTEAVAKVDMPLVPTKVSTEPSKAPPLPEGVYRVGPVNDPGNMPAGPVGPPEPGGSGSAVVVNTPVRVIEEPPPVAPSPAPKPKPPQSKGVVNGFAEYLPKPDYPPIAKAAHAFGLVKVQVLIDEQGNVTSAKAVSGHPLLQLAAQSAAKRARFKPTLLSGEPVKVTGVIDYNFVQ